MSEDGSASDAPTEVFVISDGTGETCAAAVRAAMLQFQAPWRLKIFGGIRHASEIERVMPQAAEAGALVVFSLVDGRVVEALQKSAERAGVTAVDLLGPLIARVAQKLQTEPRHQPGLLHGYTDEHFARVAAVEFAVQHDDGANLQTLPEADIVLTGVSRTSKTPLSIYLAQRGYKTGNVPLVPGVDPPKVLLEMDPKKIFGLLVDESTLLTVRKARVSSMRSGRSSTSYTDTSSVETELQAARRLFREYGWRTIEITGRAVEENAARILDVYEADPPGRDA